jgi:hypothetical protein
MEQLSYGRSEMNSHEYEMVIKALLNQISDLQDSITIYEMMNQQQTDNDDDPFRVGYGITRDAINEHVWPEPTKKRRGRPPGVKNKKPAPKKRGRPAKKAS